MGIFLGKTELNDALNSIRSKKSELYSRLNAEKEVGELLEKHLPEDIYIIAHPQIGEYDPDFLVISTRFGCRVIEVQSWNPEDITEIDTDGSITLKDNRQINLSDQIKKHRDELSIFLDTNLGMTNVTIDGLIVHYRFTMEEFKEKAAKVFPPDYYRNLLFKDQIDSRIEQRLKASSKYVNRGLIESNIQTILSAIEISENIAKEKKYFHVTIIEPEKTEEEPEVEEQETEETTQTEETQETEKDLGQEPAEEETQETPPEAEPPVIFANLEEEKKKINWQYIMIALLILALLIGGIFVIKNLPLFDKGNSGSKNINITSKSNTITPSGTIYQLINGTTSSVEQEMTLTVTKYLYDSRNQIIFLILTDGTNTIDALLDKNTENALQINEGSEYTIKGVLEKSQSGDRLIIREIKLADK